MAPLPSAPAVTAYQTGSGRPQVRPGQWADSGGRQHAPRKTGPPSRTQIRASSSCQGCISLAVLMLAPFLCPCHLPLLYYDHLQHTQDGEHALVICLLLNLDQVPKNKLYFTLDPTATDISQKADSPWSNCGFRALLRGPMMKSGCRLWDINLLVTGTVS